MENPFQETVTVQPTDESLVRQAQDGCRQALEQLVKRHQVWIYNIAVRMVWIPFRARVDCAGCPAVSWGSHRSDEKSGLSRPAVEAKRVAPRDMNGLPSLLGWRPLVFLVRRQPQRGAT